MPQLNERVDLGMKKVFSKLKEEFKAVLPPTIFFFVALHLVALMRVLMLKGTGIAVSTPLQVTLAAFYPRQGGAAGRRPAVYQSVSTQAVDL